MCCYLLILISVLGEVKSSSPSESPLMEKREVVDAHIPILKTVPEESASTQTSNTPQPAPSSEERRVTFDIGDSDEAETKETETSNGNAESLGS